MQPTLRPPLRTLRSGFPPYVLLFQLFQIYTPFPLLQVSVLYLPPDPPFWLPRRARPQNLLFEGVSISTLWQTAHH